MYKQPLIRKSFFRKSYKKAFCDGGLLSNLKIHIMIYCGSFMSVGQIRKFIVKEDADSDS